VRVAVRIHDDRHASESGGAYLMAEIAALRQPFGRLRG
jgi:hypothetical protein